MIIFLYGQDSYRSRQKLRELKSKFLKEIDQTGAELIILDGATLTFDAWRQAIGAVSMFAAKRCVVVERFLSAGSKAAQGQVLGYLRGASLTDVILIFWEDQLAPEKKRRSKKPASASNLGEFLKQQKYAQEFTPLTASKLTNWLKQEFAQHQVKIENDALLELVVLVGADTWRAKQAVEKLSAYVNGAAKTVSLADVRFLVAGQDEANIFDLVDALAQKQTKRALTLLRQALVNGQAEIFILSLITRQFRLLIMVKSALGDGVPAARLASLLGQHPFVIKKLVAQAGHYQPTELKNIYQQLMWIDALLKSSDVNARQLIEQFIIIWTGSVSPKPSLVEIYGARPCFF